MEQPKYMLIEVLNLIKDLASATHAGEQAVIVSRVDAHLAELIKSEPADVPPADPSETK
jgi:hypothetical protein